MEGCTIINSKNQILNPYKNKNTNIIFASSFLKNSGIKKINQTSDKYLTYLCSRIARTQCHITIATSSAPTAFFFNQNGLIEIVITSGLIKHIKTEDSLAFVIAHEISHIKLNHLNVIDLFNRKSDSFFEKRAKLEIEADSSAIETIIKMKYSPLPALNLLALLKNIFQFNFKNTQTGYPDVALRFRKLQDKIINLKRLGNINKLPTYSIAFNKLKHDISHH